jgi:hypothetical protein
MKPIRSRSGGLAHRLALTATGLALVTLAVGCQDATSPRGQGTAPLRPSYLILPAMFSANADLTGMVDGESDTSPARGVVGFEWCKVGDGSVFTLEWNGTIRNPQRETFLRGAIRFTGDGSVLPSDLQAELAGIVLLSGSSSSKRFTLAGEQDISDRLASVMYEDPNEFVVTLFSREHPAGAIQGNLISGPTL